MRRAAGWLLVVLPVACAEGQSPAVTGATATDWPPASGSGSTEAGNELGSSTGEDDRGESITTDPGEVSSGSTEESGGEPAYDCAPLWTTAWIGSPCSRDDECTYSGGFCLRADQGFPCGTCSQACDNLCPDLEGTPVTFCIDGADVGLAGGGSCVSRCDSALLGGNGCRDGYACTTLGRFREPGTSSAVCVPEDLTAPETDCAAELDQLGAAWEPAQYTPESPDGYPNLVCSIAEPVRLYEPIPGMTMRYVSSNGPGNVLVSCETAVRIAHSAQVAADMGAVEFVHYGTYNCRPISGTNTLSQHSYAAAIDVYGFTLEDGTLYSVIDDWEDFVEVPTTAAGSWLRDFSDAIWDMGFWTIILSPEYNDDHDNHLHVDHTVGGHYYYWE